LNSLSLRTAAIAII